MVELMKPYKTILLKYSMGRYKWILISSGKNSMMGSPLVEMQCGKNSQFFIGYTLHPGNAQYMLRAGRMLCYVDTVVETP